MLYAVMSEAMPARGSASALRSGSCSAARACEQSARRGVGGDAMAGACWQTAGVQQEAANKPQSACVG